MAALPGVAEVADASRKAFDEILWDRRLRGQAQELSRRSALAGAASSAGIDGLEIEWRVWQAGQAADDTPMGRAAAGLVALYAQIPQLRATWEAAPLQALAKMHTLVALPVAREEVGRPRSGAPRDALRLGTAVGADEVAERLSALAGAVTSPTTAPALVVAGVVHAEIMTVQPFTYGSGFIARAADRLMLSTRGVDPDNWSVPEAGVHEQGRPAYARALRRYAEGGSEGVADWLVFYCRAMAGGTQNLDALVG